MCQLLQVLYLDSLEVDVPVKKCAIRVEAWTGKEIAWVINLDLKEDGDFGKLRVTSYFSEDYMPTVFSIYLL